MGSNPTPCTISARDCWITLRLSVINATIINATLPGFGFHESQSVIENNGAEVAISRRLVRADATDYANLGQAYVKPNNGVSTFKITYSIDIPFNWNYPLGVDSIPVARACRSSVAFRSLWTCYQSS